MSRINKQFVALILVVAASAHAQPTVNMDTGISMKQCIKAGQLPLVRCDKTPLTGQDGQTGTDTDPLNNGGADGRLASSYKRMCNTGDVAGEKSCPAVPVLGPGANDWGCTIDERTGMVWEVKTATGPRGMSLTYSNYSRTYDPLGLFGSPTDAQGYVDAVNRQGLCGADDWGLGHSSKLQAAVDYGVDGTHGRFDATFFPNGAPGPHWNASQNPSREDTAWEMDFTTGELENSGDRGLMRPVVLVRGKPALGSKSTYTLSPDGTEATDISPGATITWRRCVEGMTWNGSTCRGTPEQFTLVEALQHAASEAALTGLPWRVPNVKELDWTVRREHLAPSIDGVEFPGTPVGRYCTSTPDVVTPGNAWTIDFEVGSVLLASRNTPCLVRLGR